jgi:SAM-dependent methyltransferase
MSDQAEKIRSEVARDYAAAVSKTVKSCGCCCGTEKERKGAVVSMAGYGKDELDTLPKEAVVNSFGCGNPVALAGLRPGQTVLDLGSGAGIDLLLAAKKVGPGGHVIGIDMTDEMIAKARENIRAAGVKNIEVRKGIIEDLPVDSASVDWVISNCVINLSPEKPRVFSEIARVLRPGGQMLVSDIVAKDLPDEVKNDLAMYSSCVGGAIDEEQYLAGLRGAGLEGVEVRDRLVYDSSFIEAVIGSEIEGLCVNGSIGKDRMKELARQLDGKVWSAKIYGKKR